MTKTSKHICLNTYCCKYCCNIDLKTKAISGFCLKKGTPDKVLPCKSQLADMTVCNAPIRRQHPKWECFDWACDGCGPEAVRQHLMPLPELYRGVWIAQWLERWTRDPKVPAGAAGEFSSPWSTFCADFYFGIRSTPHVTAVAHKRSWSFCQKCRWQVTAKTCMHLTYASQ